MPDAPGCPGHRSQPRDRCGHGQGAGRAGHRRPLRLLPQRAARWTRRPGAAGGVPGHADGAGGQRRRIDPGRRRPRRGHGGRPVRRRRASPSLFDAAEAELGPVSILVNNASGWVADTLRPRRGTNRFGLAQAPVSARHDRPGLRGRRPRRRTPDRRVRAPPRRPGWRLGPHHRPDLGRQRTGSPRRSPTARPRRHRSTSP